MTTYKIEPGGIACCLALRVDGGPPISCIYMSEEKGVVVNLRGTQV